MKNWHQYAWATMVTGCFLAMCFAIHAEEKPKTIGFVPKEIAADGDKKAFEADTIRTKRILLTSDDGKSRITIQSVANAVGIWVESRNGTVCLVGSSARDDPAFFGSIPHEYKPGDGFPLAIKSDGSIQLAQKGKVKMISLDQLMRLAK